MQRTRTTTIIEERTRGRTRSAGRVVSRNKDFPAERAAAARTRVAAQEGRHESEGGHPVIAAALALLAEGGQT